MRLTLVFGLLVENQRQRVLKEQLMSFRQQGRAIDLYGRIHVHRVGNQAGLMLNIIKHFVELQRIGIANGLELI